MEDWRQIVHRAVTGETIPPSPAVVAQTHVILDLLAARDVRATFFVLGTVAERYPELVRRIQGAGHEIASHGLSHIPVHRQTPTEFRTETRRAKEVLESITGDPVHGYRAAEFSITQRSLWALDVLAELGFRYDSSIFPISARRYGIRDAPRHPHWMPLSDGGGIREYPLATIERAGRRWPVAGGGYFRLLPYRVTRGAIGAINTDGDPAVVYLHPYEFSQSVLQIERRRLPVRARARLLRYSTVHNLARERLATRFQRLLHDFEFVPLKELMDEDS
ncbi:MAG TPA: DUF3473 domain-containing protein [Nitriliruptorales bacterium]|nr:DUF3473 domain-containing protein [Nitriliruptorales bacterium]